MNNAVELKRLSNCRLFAGYIGAAAFAVSLAVFAGWQFDVSALKSVIPGAATMKPFTALCFALSGISLWLLSSASKPETKARSDLGRINAARFCSIAVALVGLATLSEHYTGINFSFEELLFPKALAASGLPNPGRMSAATAMNFLLLGAALTFQSFIARRDRRIDQLFALSVMLISGIALLGYLFGVRSLYSIFAYSSMALHTAMLFFVLGAGILFSRPDSGVMTVINSQHFGGFAARRLLPIVILLPVFLGLLRVQGESIGLYDAVFGRTLFVASNIFILAAVVWNSARQLNSIDIERRRTDLAIKESEERLQLFVEHAPASLAMFDREMRYLTASRRWMDDFNLAGKDVRGISHYEIFPEISDQWKEVHSRALVGEILREDEDRFDRADGSTQWLRWEVRPWRDAAGDVGGIVIFCEDISESKRAKEELVKRTEDLTRSNADLEQFAYVASHDLQEPLRAVAGCVQLLQKRYQGQIDARADEFIGHAVDGARRMQKMIDDLLTFSRVGTRGDLLQPISSEEALKTALKNLTAAIEESAAVVEHDSLPNVRADSTQLTSLFQNLIGNAVKFRSDAAPLIQIGAKREGKQWEFSVRDNGIGFEPEYSERIFGVFQRLHTRTEYSGTGIGLALCKKIVERHGGKIWVESTPGKGSVFYFTLADAQ